MNQFPKKYKPQDLRNWSIKYRNERLNNKNYVFSISSLPISHKITYKDFFTIYMNNFFVHKKNIENNQIHQGSNSPLFEQLFIIEGNQFSSIYDSYSFFYKKNQSLSQVGTIKLKRHMISQGKKIFNINKKILDSYLSSEHKLYIPDSEMYIYIVETLNKLRNKGKISNKIKIGYRSFNLQTTIPDSEISRREKTIPYYVVKYFVGAKCEALPVCIQNIDLCCGDVALLVHPKDKRYNKYIGRNAIIPLCNRQIPILGDENVNIAIDNGIKRICPCCDEESIELAKKYGLPTNIFVFNKQGLYTEYIHEQAFIGQKRNKYYDNIVGFIDDIGNLASKGEKKVKIPYLKDTNEILIPYQIEETIIDTKEEKERILNKIYEGKITLTFSNKIFEEKLEELEHYQKFFNNIQNGDANYYSGKINETDHEIDNLKSKISQIKLDFSELINDFLPDNMTLNSQLPYGWRTPIIKNKKGETFFLSIENFYTKGQKASLQICFNTVLLSIIFSGILGTKKFGNDHQEYKICEYDKIFTILSQNEKTIEYFINYLTNKLGNQQEYNKILEIIQNLANENHSSTNELIKLLKNCKFIKQEGIRILLNIEGLSNDIINPQFYQSCILSYLNNKNIKINNQIFINEHEKNKIFKELLIQELLLGKTLFNEIIEFPCNKNEEILTEKSPNGIKNNQLQQEIISLFGENPIRLNLLIDQSYNQEKILLNSIFLKQIWNAVRLCIQKNFLPKNIKQCLIEQPENFEDFDILVLYKLNELYNDFLNIKSYEEYIKFFENFKKVAQNIFFSRYLEIQKINPSKNTKFICSYFFNFLLTLLYPLIPEFVEAIQYISNKEFVFPINSIKLEKSVDYSTNTLYNTFIKIKEIKLECNIKQHEPCNIFIKSNPSILEFFINHDSIFKNYFHIPEILYLRLHEQIPLGYDIFEENELTIGIQSVNTKSKNNKETVETLERDIKNLEDKLQLLRQRIQILPEGEQRTKAEEEYTKTKEEMEALTIKHSLLNNK